MNSKDEGCGIALLALLALPVVIVVSAIANGFVLSVMWSWFVVPVFGIAALTVVQAIGFSMVVSFLTYHDTESKTDDSKSLTEKIIYMVMMAIMRPAFTLGIAWIIHLFL